jgi:hypothetical protein
MNERQKAAWSGVLLTVIRVGILLGGLLGLRLTENEALGALSVRRSRGVSTPRVALPRATSLLS